MSKRLANIPLVYNIAGLFFLILIGAAVVYMLILFWPGSRPTDKTPVTQTQHPAAAGVSK